MISRPFLLKLFTSVSLLALSTASAQHDRAGHTGGLDGLYLNANLGLIAYAYDSELLENGFSVGKIKATKTFGGRFSAGYHLNEDYDVQLSVMRPGAWTSYKDISPPDQDGTVWTNIWAITGRRHIDLAESTGIVLEAGVGNVSRHGINIDGQEVIKDAHYLHPLFGFGLRQKISDKWHLSLNATYSPPKKSINQPATTLVTAGTEFSLTRLSDEKIKKNKKTPYYFPKHIIQVAYSGDWAGFDINRQFSTGLSTSIPVFWLGDVLVNSGFVASYQHNIFHTYKNFSLDWGGSIATFRTQQGDSFYAVSIFPVIRWWFIRTRAMDAYFNYSLIGPAYISSSVLDGIDTGEEATLQDFMGIGFLLFNEKKVNLDFKIMHYSNGNIFTKNPGIAIPLTIGLGYAFN